MMATKEGHSMTNRVRWGTLGSSRFLANYSFPEISASAAAQLWAVASRSPDRAAMLAERLGVETSYGSYEELLADPEIDLVYNALPNHLHAEWSLKALKAGKHVLCEKPLTPTPEEAHNLVNAFAESPQFLFEGYMWRHHPQWAELARMISAGVIGKPVLVQCHYCYFDRGEDSARNNPACGGGALLMIGCYPISMASFVFAGQSANRLVSSVDMDPDFGVDRLATCIVEFDEGRAEFSVGTQLWDDQTLTVYGSKGWIRVKVPVTPGSNDPTELIVNSEDDGERVVVVPPASQFALQADAISLDIQSGHRPDLSEGIRALEVIAAIRQSAKTRRWVQIPSGS